MNDKFINEQKAEALRHFASEMRGKVGSGGPEFDRGFMAALLCADLEAGRLTAIAESGKI